MRVRCRLEFEYPTHARAEKVARSLRVDDDIYVKTTVAGRILVAEAETDSLVGLLHTVEDYLACLSVAEKVLGG